VARQWRGGAPDVAAASVQTLAAAGNLDLQLVAAIKRNPELVRTLLDLIEGVA
jgi:hypothetical protein